ncbi:Hypothetical_protein [Hexamita inflata]|uniref:Hypothetical_protein n=1 Tax=Hexamita inflata TaxID=28002 RepID=A0ABP1I7J8_9EUKA
MQVFNYKLNSLQTQDLSAFSEFVEIQQQCYSEFYEIEIDNRRQMRLLQIQLTYKDIKKLIKHKQEIFCALYRQITKLQSQAQQIQIDINKLMMKVQTCYVNVYE